MKMGCSKQYKLPTASVKMTESLGLVAGAALLQSTHFRMPSFTVSYEGSASTSGRVRGGGAGFALCRVVAVSTIAGPSSWTAQLSRLGASGAGRDSSAPVLLLGTAALGCCAIARRTGAAAKKF